MIKELFQIAIIQLEMKDSNNSGDFFRLKISKKNLIGKSIFLSVFSEIISIQLNKPLYIPILSFFLILKFFVN